MNNKVVIGIVVAVLLILGIGGYFFVNKNQTPTGSMSGSEAMTPGENSAQPQSFLDLLTGGAKKCTFAETTDQTQTSGTAYVANGKIRTDIASTVAGKEMNSHMILISPTVYVWTEGQANGFKMEVSPEKPDQAMGGTEKTPPTEGVDVQKKMDFQCQSWIADNSLFDLPANVEFADMSSMMAPKGSSAPAMENTKTLQCAACNNLSGDQKTQCLSALGCQ